MSLTDHDRDVIQATVRETLVQVGLDPSDPIESQADFRFLRQWRKGSESAAGKMLATLLVLLVTGAVGVLIAGAKVKKLIPGG